MNKNSLSISDLALLYFPNHSRRNAVARLHRWISVNLLLRKKLEELYYVPHQRILTPLQCEAIIEALGEP